MTRSRTQPASTRDLQSTPGVKYMLRVRDIMTKKVYTVDFDASADEAAWGLKSLLES